MIRGPFLHRDAEGFTFIEVLVATSAFLLLFGAVSGVFTAFTRQQRAGLGTATLLSEFQNVFETLEREARTGYGNTFATPSGATAFRFKNQNVQEVTYRHDAAGKRIVREVSGGTSQVLTSRAVEVLSLAFLVTAPVVDTGVAPQIPILTGAQGRVTVSTRLCPAGGESPRCLTVQTTLTSRQYVPK